MQNQPNYEGDKLPGFQQPTQGDYMFVPFLGYKKSFYFGFLWLLVELIFAKEQALTVENYFCP